MTNPEKGYHFEWKAEDEHLTQVLGKLLEKSDLPFHTYTRNGQQVVYLKGAQQIADTLALMGAGQSVLQMENIRIQKQLRAAAVRAANCDEHNGERMLDAAQKQAEAIRRLSLKQGLFTLPPALQRALITYSGVSGPSDTVTRPALPRMRGVPAAGSCPRMVPAG